MELLTKHFNKSAATQGLDLPPALTSLSFAGLCLSSYVAGYREVYKFLNLLGTVFGWVGSDVWAKIVTLQKYMDGAEKEHYTNIKAMIAHEVAPVLFLVSA